MNAKQLADYVVSPVLRDLGMSGDPAYQLMLGTAAQESMGFEYIHQIGGGPAMGLWQMEPAAHRDIVANYLEYRPELAAKVFRASGCSGFDSNNLLKNLSYACAMARVHYYRVPAAIPTTLDGQARYWKEHYNTHLGKGSEEEYVDNFNRYVAGRV